MDSDISITINRATISTFYKYKNEDKENICKLCRSSLMLPTFEDIEKLKSQLIVSKGVCGHYFHKTCIDKYVQSGKISCPIDYTTWKLNTTYIDGIPESEKKYVEVSAKKSNSWFDVRDKNIISASNMSGILGDDKYKSMDDYIKNIIDNNSNSQLPSVNPSFFSSSIITTKVSKPPSKQYMI
jgi:hypothetical protein